MIFIFEDSPGSWTSRYFRKCYPQDSLDDKIFYTCGNRYIPTKLDEMLTKGRIDEEVVIFLDVVPDNKKTADMYNLISKTYKSKFKRLIIMPIPCIEFYYIEALRQNGNIIVDKEQIDIVHQRGWHKHQKLKRNFAECRTYFQFEKFCKLVMKRQFISCITSYDGENVAYYDCNCLDCKKRYKICRHRQTDTAVAKRKTLLKQFPCVPMGSYLYQGRFMSWGDLIVIHRQLVNQYNDMANKYNEIDAKELNLSNQKDLPIKYKSKTISYMY